jgi:hypothetical protein
MATTILDEAQTVVMDLYAKQGSLVRQAIFWDVAGKCTINAFTSAASRDESLRELRGAAKRASATRVFFFSEASATSPDGKKVDVIALEAADRASNFYGQRLFAAGRQPELLDETISSLAESPLAGVLG